MEEEPPAAPHRKHSEVGGLAQSQQTTGDSDTDLSESERGLEPPSCRVPPQLELRSEVIEDEEDFPHRIRGRDQGRFVFPDFLPPPLNSWNLSQLAVFYSTEGRAAPRPLPTSPLQQYMEKLLQLERLQLQSIQEECGQLQGSEVMSSCQRSVAAASARLSSPKCILQCQRAFTFLSPHTTLLSSCALSPYSIHRAVCCGESRLSPLKDSRGILPVPKRSHSESRAQTSERVPGLHSCCSPSRNSSYLRRVQASGNIRHPVQDSAQTSRDHPEKGPVLLCKTTEFRKRSGSEQRTSRTKRPQKPSENRQNRSECGKGGAERGRAADSTNKQVPQSLNKFPCSKCCQLPGQRRSKAAELF